MERESRGTFARVLAGVVQAQRGSRDELLSKAQIILLERHGVLGADEYRDTQHRTPRTDGHPLVLTVLPAVLTLTGPGRWSVDQAIGLLPWAPWWAASAVGLGILSGLTTRAVLARPGLPV
ncbi:hypothetical protein ACIBJF_35000 [Streptomyces sp. NPDC050743]|uniref:hypothetical protein n=1 Tax=Streptomyces sp. NPDC050743 TaxID=3365634 RepID=UPI0037ACE001